jgi:hypothetical protein
MNPSQASIAEAARKAANDWCYNVFAWRGRSANFMQAQVRKLSDVIQRAIESVLALRRDSKSLPVPACDYCLTGLELKVLKIYRDGKATGEFFIGHTQTNGDHKRCTKYAMTQWPQPTTAGGMRELETADGQ